MTSRPVTPALLSPLLGFALGALPSPGAPVRAQVQDVPGQVARFLDGDSLLLAVAADLDAAPFVVARTSLFGGLLTKLTRVRTERVSRILIMVVLLFRLKYLTSTTGMS